MTSTAIWEFRKMDVGQKYVQPTHREHLATGGLVEPLVREAIQNSLDATLDGQVTKVMFTLGTASAEDARPYFDTLRPHLVAISSSIAEGLPGENDAVPYLAIEDYNTRGLEGDPTVHRATNVDGSPNHFFRFWHAVGAAGDFKRRGSWGVGKVVFSNASRIRTFFGLTLRTGDSGGLLMGEAGLAIHRLGDEEDVFDWYGYFGAHELRNNHFVPRPTQAPDTVASFTRVFGLTRAKSGLSVLVPHVREDLNLEALARAVIEQYFLPILAGRLEVTVKNGGQSIVITSATIEDSVGDVTWPSRGGSRSDEIKKLLDLARWQLALRPEEYVPAPAIDRPYTLEALQFPQGTLQRLSDDYARGKRIAIRVPIHVRPREGAAGREDVYIVLEHDESLRASNVPHLRSGINISKMREQGGSGARGLLVVGVDLDTQGKLDKLLQASEGPAHINWEQRGEGYDKARSLFDDAHKVIGFMRHLVRSVVELLATPPDAQDTRTLSTFFPDSGQEGVASGPGTRGRGSKKTGPGDDESAPLMAGVIEGVTRSIVPSRGLRPVAGAVVQLWRHDAVVASIMTDAEGGFRFERLEPGDYSVTGSKAGVGEARRNVALPPEHGVKVDLILRPAPTPRMFIKVPLESGFAIRGNPAYTGALRPIRVRMAYAAWGGSKSFTDADFSLNDTGMRLSFSGVAETKRENLIVAPNIIRFTPVMNEFYIEVRGFDSNRALHVDARALEDEQMGQELSS